MPKKKPKSNQELDKATVQQTKARIARSYVGSDFNSAVTLHYNNAMKWSGNESCEPDPMDVMKQLNKEVDKLLEADQDALQRRLATQAILLEKTACNYLFNISQAKYLNQITAYSQLALKAQDQARKTLATLSEIKNPKRSTTAFIKQLQVQLNQLNQLNSSHASQENSEIFEENGNELNKKQPNTGEEYVEMDTRSQEETITVV